MNFILKYSFAFHDQQGVPVILIIILHELTTSRVKTL